MADAPAGWRDYLVKSWPLGASWQGEDGRTFAGEDVRRVLAQLAAASSADTALKMRCLAHTQWRELEPAVEDWCEAEGIDPRTYYRHVNSAARIAWKFLQRPATSKP